MSTPTQISARVKKVVDPSTMAASASVPNRPTIITSTKLIDICESWTRTSGTASVSVARTSPLTGRRGMDSVGGAASYPPARPAFGAIGLCRSDAATDRGAPTPA